MALNRSPVLCAPVLFSGRQCLKPFGLCLLVSDKKIFSCFHYIIIYKTCDSWGETIFDHMGII